MKTKLISLGIALLYYTSTFSQGINVGVKAGASMNKIKGKTFKEEFSFGYHAGMFVILKLGDKIAIQPEVLFNQVNLDTSSSFSSVYQFNNVSKIRLSYLSIPLLLNYNVSNILALQVGPQFGILIDQNKDMLQNGMDAFKKGDLSMLGGVQVKLFKFRFYGRYAIGLNNLDNVGTKDKWTKESIDFGIGIAL